MIKKLMLLLLLGALAFGEIYVNGVPIDSTQSRYLIVEIDDDLRKTRAYVDYGQSDPDRHRIMTDDTGSKMLFNSPVAVLNYFYRQGWELDEAYVMPGGGESSFYGDKYFILQRKP
ncbi:MAG: hypothetical protein WC372_01900 [Candidatus Neomarinimicrobiota bacterium]|jgi:hypothetical protein|nr:hypothetical protein [Candidatus Neomarinimicrobiota bacterium]MDD3966369.1 hypothetical protein [Candidatus Neomarinimicrobiota bacterium]MDX9780558.1 hypothetical protein [bacterium]